MYPVDANMWWIVGLAILAGIAIGGFILTRTNWYRIRMYAIKVKKIFDKFKLQEKAEQVQSLGQNPNPVLAKRPLRELIAAYQGLIGDMEKVKAPPKAKDVHESTLNMHRESLQLYQMAVVGGFRQKAMVDRQRRLQQMEKSLSAKMEALYGPMKKPVKK
jgi:hypothetical protein